MLSTEGEGVADWKTDRHNLFGCLDPARHGHPGTVRSRHFSRLSSRNKNTHPYWFPHTCSTLHAPREYYLTGWRTTMGQTLCNCGHLILFMITDPGGRCRLGLRPKIVKLTLCAGTLKSRSAVSVVGCMPNQTLYGILSVLRDVSVGTPAGYKLYQVEQVRVGAISLAFLHIAVL